MAHDVGAVGRQAVRVEIIGGRLVNLLALQVVDACNLTCFLFDERRGDARGEIVGAFGERVLAVVHRQQVVGVYGLVAQDRLPIKFLLVGRSRLGGHVDTILAIGQLSEVGADVERSEEHTSELQSH